MRIFYNLPAARLVFFHVLFFVITQHSYAQCGKGTPVYTIDLTSKPDSVWFSPSVARGDTCCGSTNCIEFIVSVDSRVLAIQLDIVAGAMPTGSLFYKIDCGAQTSVGQPLCLAGTGPYKITFCKPGNNQNIYRITPIIRPTMPQTISVTEGCSGLLKTYGFIDSTVRWRSLSGSAYDSYLSCTSGCDSTYVTPQPGFPTYVDYEVCGTPACKSITLCDTIRVYMYKKFTVAVVPDNPTICYSDTAALLEAKISGGKSPYNYLWSNGQTGSKIYARPGKYWVQVKDATVCSPVVDSVTVSQVSGPATALAGNDTSICSKSTAQLKGSILNVPQGYWKGAGKFNPSDSVLNAVYTPTAGEILAGKAKLKLFTKGIYGCPEDSDEVIINIISEPQPVISGNRHLCALSYNIPYSVQSIFGHTYIWNVTGGTITGGQGTNSIFINWHNTDSGVISLTETNPTGCSTTVQTTVRLMPKPLPKITGPAAVCEYSKTSIFTAEAVNGAVYNWNVVGGKIIAGQGSTSIKIYWSGTGTGTVTLTQTLGACDSSVVKNITIYPRPQPVITGPLTVCQYADPVNYTTPYNADNNYTWQVTGGTIISSIDNYLTVKWGAAGTGKVTIHQVNAEGCDSTVTLNVLIYGRPLISIIGDSTACERTVKDYTAKDSSKTINEWLFENGLPIGGLGTNNVKIHWGSKGVGNILLKQVNEFGCDTSLLKNVDINEKPLPYINGKDTVCAHNIESYSIGFTLGHNYKWIVVNGQILGGANSSQITVQWSSAATGYIFLTEVNSKGCDTTVMAKVTIAPYPEPAISGPTRACQYQGNYLYSTPAIFGNTYIWSIYNGVLEQQVSSNTIKVKWGLEGDGFIVLKEENAYGCYKYDTFKVTVIKFRSAVTKQILYPCNPSPVQFKLDANDTLLEVLWDFGDNSTSTEITPTHIYKTPGTYTARVYCKGIAGCTDSNGTMVTIYKNPVAAFDIVYTNAEKVFYNLEDTIKFINRSVNGTRYEWHFSDGTVSSSFGGEHIFREPGEHTVTLKAYNELGCVDSTTRTLNIDAHIALLVPNAFTPTGDKVNEFFSVATHNIIQLHVEVYNRWGERVFESDDVNFKWDGTYREDPVQQDVYMYFIKAKNVKGEAVFRKGTLTLIRQ